jgi:hypothetical protein
LESYINDNRGPSSAERSAPLVAILNEALSIRVNDDDDDDNAGCDEELDVGDAGTRQQHEGR